MENDLSAVDGEGIEDLIISEIRKLQANSKEQILLQSPMPLKADMA